MAMNRKPPSATNTAKDSERDTSNTDPITRSVKSIPHIAVEVMNKVIDTIVWPDSAKRMSVIGGGFESMVLA